MNTPKIIIDKTPDEKWFFILLSGSGDLLATSPGYESKQACLSGIDSLIASAIRAEIIEKNTYKVKH